MTTHTPAPAEQDFVATELRGIIDVCGDSPTAIVSVERMRLWLSKLRAPVAKPKRAPLDDWRVQAIAECLETEWDDMTPASAEADARLIVGYLTAYEKESDEIEARHAAEPVDPVVQAARNLRASAPVAGDARPAAWLHQCRKKPELTQVTMKKHEPALAAKGFRPVPLYAAPQASEAELKEAAAIARSFGAPDMADALDPAKGASQDSEAVRDAGIAASVGAALPKPIQYSPNDGPERALWKDGWNDCVRHAEQLRAALSAQPGAQKGGSDA